MGEEERQRRAMQSYSQLRRTVGGKTGLSYRRSTLKQAWSLRREHFHSLLVFLLKALQVYAGVASEIAFNCNLKKNCVLSISNLKV